MGISEHIDRWATNGPQETICGASFTCLRPGLSVTQLALRNGRPFTIAGKTQGFLYEGAKFMPFDFPGAMASFALEINAAGQKTGGYTGSDGKMHGFVANNEKGNRRFFSFFYLNRCLS
jgi:hypothetical protein